MSTRRSLLPGSRLGKFIVGALVAVVVLAALVMGARLLRENPGVVQFIADHPGHVPLPDDAPVGIPAWLGWQHFLNALMLVLIIRSGWLIRTTRRPEGYWSPRRRRTGATPQRIAVMQWFHVSVDALWLVNGVVFVVLLVVTGQWLRVVPTSLDFVPHALSVALQYASLDWPLENGWVNYNALQVIAYFVTIFVAAPLAAATGFRMSALWPRGRAALDRAYPIEWARRVHFPVMIYFCAFIVAHVTLVLTTGALRNLNHIFAARDDAGWLGFILFAVSLVVMVAAWLAVRPAVVRALASTAGTVTR